MTNMAAIQKFWQRCGRPYMRAGSTGKRRPDRKPSAHKLRDAATPSELAAHRAAIEHDYFRGNMERIQLVREAAAEFDRAMANKRRDRGRRKKS